MEIKQGDKVRVSKDAPKVYQKGSVFDYTEHQSTVHEVDGDAAIIGLDIEDSPIYSAPIAIPTKYLVKVDAEAKEAKIKLGDIVRVKGNLHEPFCLDADLHLEITNIPPHAVSQKEWKVIRVENRRDCAGHIYTLNRDDSFIHNIPEDCVELIEPTAPTIKAGDRVRNVKSDLCGIALNIEHGIVEVGIPYDKEKRYWNTDIVELFEPTEQTHQRATIISEGDIHSLDETPTNNVGSIKIPVEVDLSDSYWNAYTADLAKEVALKVANKFNDPEQAAEYAVSVAKAVVEGLKRK